MEFISLTQKPVLLVGKLIGASVTVGLFLCLVMT